MNTEEEAAALQVELQVLREENQEQARELAAERVRGWGPTCRHGILRKCCPPCRGDAT